MTSHACGKHNDDNDQSNARTMSTGVSVAADGPSLGLLTCPFVGASALLRWRKDLTLGVGKMNTAVRDAGGSTVGLLLCNAKPSRHLLALIILLARNYPSHTTSWAFHITMPAWDEVDVSMKDGLPSILSNVHATLPASSTSNSNK
jgi:hypothetical protein